jgi:hypothetical protein
MHWSNKNFPSLAYSNIIMLPLLQARLADAVLQLNGGPSGPAAHTPVELKRQLSLAQNQLAEAKQQIKQLDLEVGCKCSHS